MLAPFFLRSLISSPAHANMLRFFPGGRRSCWRQPPCEALFLRRFTPTCPSFSRTVPGRVGAVLPARPYFFAGSRQHAPVFPGWSPAVLAPSSLRSLISSPGHANMLRFFPGGRRPCWRRPPCEALFLRRLTPTCSGFSRAVAGHVGAVLPSCKALFLRRVTPTYSGFSRAVAGHVGAVLLAKPYFFAGSRQHAPVFPGRVPTMLAPSFLRSLISPPGHANMLRRHPARILPASHFSYSAST